MSWCKKHLNWTLGLLLIVPFILILILYNTVLPDPVFLAIYVIVWVIAIIVACWWVTVQKGQSLFNLLYLLIIFWGIFHIMGLKNRKEGEK